MIKTCSKCGQKKTKKNGETVYVKTVTIATNGNMQQKADQLLELAPDAEKQKRKLNGTAVNVANVFMNTDADGLNDPKRG